MTYNPADLLAVRAYTQTHTDQTAISLGIAGDAEHMAGGGYHLGYDDLHALDAAPEDLGSDYSYTESTRDRNGLTNAASAFDLGGDFPRFREITTGIVAACKRGDPRTRDIREVIYTPDGFTVRRWDRLGIRNSGDDSHLWHTHVSFFRDSEGRRDKPDNFLGLLTELFDGADPLPASEEDRMYQQQIPAGVGARVVLPFPYSADDHPGFSIATDTGPSGRTKAVWRVAAHKADVGWQVSVVTTDSQDGRRKDVPLQPGTDRVSVTRQAADNTDPCDVPASALAWW